MKPKWFNIVNKRIIWNELELKSLKISHWIMLISNGPLSKFKSFIRLLFSKPGTCMLMAGLGINGPKPLLGRSAYQKGDHKVCKKNLFSETFWGINSSVPLYILVIFGLCMVRDPTFFARFSAFGTVTVILILFTAFYKVSFYISI